MATVLAQYRNRPDDQSQKFSQKRIWRLSKVAYETEPGYFPGIARIPLERASDRSAARSAARPSPMRARI
jgi:hypothetical protein